jgi:hypothetical protein
MSAVLDLLLSLRLRRPDLWLLGELLSHPHQLIEANDLLHGHDLRIG